MITIVDVSSVVYLMREIFYYVLYTDGKSKSAPPYNFFVFNLTVLWLGISLTIVFCYHSRFTKSFYLNNLLYTEFNTKMHQETFDFDSQN